MTFTTIIKRLGLAAGCTALSVGLAGCGDDVADDAASVTPAPTVTTSVAPTVPATSSAAPVVDDGCPPDVNLLFERLKEAKDIVESIDPSLTGIEEPTCADGWAVARTVVKNADPGLVLFKYDPTTGRWVPVGFGTAEVCDGANVPAAVQEKLGPGC